MTNKAAYLGFGALIATMAVSSAAYDAVNNANDEFAEYKRRHISFSFDDAARCLGTENAIAFNKAIENGVGGEIKTRLSSDSECGYYLVSKNADTGEQQEVALDLRIP